MLLRDEPDPRQHRHCVVARREPEHAHLADGRLGEADRELQERRLAGAVRADERRHRARRNLERAVAERPVRAVALARAVRLERRGVAHATLETAGGRTVSAKRAAMFSSSRPAARAWLIQRCERRAELLHVVRRERSQLARDERADPAAALDEPFAIELAVGLQHRVRVDRQAAHDLLHRRQLVARPEDPQPHRLPHLLHELEIGRDARTGFQMKLDHASPLSLGGLSSVVDKQRYTYGASRCQAVGPREYGPGGDGVQGAARYERQGEGSSRSLASR